MAVTKAKKQEQLAELIEDFKAAKSVVFSQYQGTSVKAMENLRSKLRENEVEFKVARKTLVKLAAKEAGFGDLDPSVLEGAVGLAFAKNDEVIGAKTLHDLGKDVETLKIIGAIFEGKCLNAAMAQQIAQLPGRQVLLTQLVGLMMSPISGFHGVLHGVMRSFVCALSEVAKKKGSGELGGAPAPIPEEAPAVAEAEMPAADASAPAPEMATAEMPAPETEAPAAEEKSADEAAA